MMIGHKSLSHFWQKRHIPPYALALATIIPAVIIVFSLVSANAVVKLISFAACGIYLGFQMVVLAALRAHVLGWKPAGPWNMGRWGLAINCLALTYGVAAMVNMCWPRGGPDAPFLDNYIVLVGLIIVLVVGGIYMMIAKPYAHGDQPWSDAIKSAAAASPTGPGASAPVEPLPDES
jgi:amino acid transporter